MDTFRHIMMAELSIIPELKEYRLPSAFKLLEDVSVKNAAKLEGIEEVKVAIIKCERVKLATEMEQRRVAICEICNGIISSLASIASLSIDSSAEGIKESVITSGELCALIELAKNELEKAVSVLHDIASQREEIIRFEGDDKKASMIIDEVDKRVKEVELIIEKAEERRMIVEEEEETKKRVAVFCMDDWNGLVPSLVESIEVMDHCCSEENMKVLDLSVFIKLRELKVGSWCFCQVEELNMIGLRCLESVVIGKSSFAKLPYSTEDGRDDNRHFYLKNCLSLRVFKIGLKAFMDYSVCEIENVDALEVIEMGDLNEESSNFWFASLELKSILIHSE